jgi:TonB-dependent SusC/RagA subfamily outer membrane receptor
MQPSIRERRAPAPSFVSANGVAPGRLPRFQEDAMPITLTRLHGLAPAAVLAVFAAVGCGAPPDWGEPEPERDTDPSVLQREEMNTSAVTMEELLVGRLPGVNVRRAGGGLSIQIRGVNSVNAGTDALIIIDGVQSSGLALASVNPDDVQRVEVIKDGSAAMYGVRGANGVLVVTTRRR